MTYEEFRETFRLLLKESGLPAFGEPNEVLDLRTLNRTFQVHVEPISGQVTQPFHVTASISWRWSSFQTSRGMLCEEETIREMLGDDAEDMDTDRPFLRIDIKLSASTPHDKPLPMPSQPKWAAWARETLVRLERVEPLLPKEHFEEQDDGRFAILAWQGGPVAKVTCSPDGELRLESLRLDAFQLLDLPRRWDDPDREPDELPDAKLRQIFARVKASLYGWMEALDHLKP